MRWHEFGYVVGEWGAEWGLPWSLASQPKGPVLLPVSMNCIERHFDTLGNSVWV